MRMRIVRSVALCAPFVLLLSACGGGARPPAGSSGGTGEAVKLQGAGASFPAPLYNKWFKAYSAAHHNVLVDYQSVGSGSGVKSVIDHTVDFGASDAAMKQEDMAKVFGGVQLFPLTAGSIVLAYNLNGVQALKLSRKAYSGIFLGTIKRWNDPLMAASNPGVTLPDLPVNVVVRADSSGTSFVVTHNLQQAQRVADYTGFLYVDTNQGGRTGYLVEFGDSDQVFKNPVHPHTQQYIRGEFS
jgi:phosphate transport system substrate-binding protein